MLDGRRQCHQERKQEKKNFAGGVQPGAKQKGVGVIKGRCRGKRGPDSKEPRFRKGAERRRKGRKLSETPSRANRTTRGEIAEGLRMENINPAGSTKPRWEWRTKVAKREDS